jgi:hypothetical protein
MYPGSFSPRLNRGPVIPDPWSAAHDQIGPLELSPPQAGGRGWLLTAVVVLGLSSGIGSKFNSNFNLPHTDSQSAVNLLTQNFPTASGEGDQVVFQATHGATIRSASTRAAATAALARVAKVPGVETVVSPYSPYSASGAGVDPCGLTA